MSSDTHILYISLLNVYSADVHTCTCAPEDTHTDGINGTTQSSPKLDADIHQESRAGEGASDKEMLHGKENEGTWL